ncbi:MAG TPA: hypothetical protein ENN22_08060 [bacterium]|nr:hypothetical protein [bacterium]
MSCVSFVIILHSLFFVPLYFNLFVNCSLFLVLFSSFFVLWSFLFFGLRSYYATSAKFRSSR